MVIPSVVAKYNAAKVLQHVRADWSISKANHLLLVGRRPERTYEAEVDLPFRSSRVALYHRNGDFWDKISDEFPIRSTSTSTSKPLDSDARTIEGHFQRGNKDYFYGHASVPEGVFQLTTDTLRGKSIAFLISDWGRKGTVTLPDPQILTACHVISDRNTSSIVDSVPALHSTSIEKGGCTIHGSPTRRWSHKDSLGCMTLLNLPSVSGQKADWDIFVSKIESEAVFSRKTPVVLVVLPFEKISDPDGAMAQKVAIRYPNSKGGLMPEVSLIK